MHLRLSHGEHHLAGHLAVLKEAKRVLSLGQHERPVEGWHYFSGLYERGKVLKLSSPDQAEKRRQPLADER
jgi:hypothetical protein